MKSMQTYPILALQFLLSSICQQNIKPPRARCESYLIWKLLSEECFTVRYDLICSSEILPWCCTVCAIIVICCTVASKSEDGWPVILNLLYHTTFRMCCKSYQRPYKLFSSTMSWAISPVSHMASYPHERAERLNGVHVKCVSEYSALTR